MTPLQRALAVPKTQAQMEALYAEAWRLHGTTRKQVDALVASAAEEMWMNDLYTVVVQRTSEGAVAHLSIRRNDREAAHDWRDFQAIKNQLAGTEAEAIELYPAESRLVDTANQYHLFVMPPGALDEVGFNFGRVVNDGNEATEIIGAKQRKGAGDDDPQGAAGARR